MKRFYRKTVGEGLEVLVTIAIYGLGYPLLALLSVIPFLIGLPKELYNTYKQGKSGGTT